jgi:hypothetical protein
MIKKDKVTMNLVQQVKHWAGLGLEIDVELSRAFLSPGSTLLYHVTLNSEETIQVRALHAEVVKGNAAPGSSEWGSESAYCAAEPVRDIEVPGGMPYSMAGSIQLPPDIPLTVNHDEDGIYWSLRVSADIPGGRDPSIIVGFVVGPAYSFPWQTMEPIRFSTADQAYEITARGECSIVQMEAHTNDLIQTTSGLISEALSDLLEEQSAFVTERDRPSYLRDLSGALQEIVIPRVRTATSIPVDSVLALTVEEITVDPAP